MRNKECRLVDIISTLTPRAALMAALKNRRWLAPVNVALRWNSAQNDDRVFVFRRLSDVRANKSVERGDQSMDVDLQAFLTHGT
jgi:hypothetical protein